MHPIMPDSPSGNRHDRYMNILAKVAWDTQSTPTGNARLASCVVLYNDIVSFGVNEMKSHPFQARYGKNKNSVYLHAETCAIKNALRYISVSDLTKSTLYTCRVKFEDQTRHKLIFGLAKPCSGCIRCISAFGIRRVVFSLDNYGYDML
jgi:tRNA(Arg) A34 adenosine deaminase TadA